MLPLWLYGILRFYVTPLSAFVVPWLAVTCFPFMGPSRIYTLLGDVIAWVGLSILAFEGWRLARHVLNKVTVRCPGCGSIKRGNERPSTTFHASFTCRCGAASNPMPPLSLLIGVLLSAGGLFTLKGATEKAHPVDQGKLTLVVIGLLMLFAGSLFLGMWRPVRRWIVGRWPKVSQIPSDAVLGVLAASIPGLLFICIGLLSEDTSSMPAGRGPVIASGMAFFSAGLMVACNESKLICPVWLSKMVTLTLIASFVGVIATLCMNNLSPSNYRTGLLIYAGVFIGLYVKWLNPKGRS